MIAYFRRRWRQKTGTVQGFLKLRTQQGNEVVLDFPLEAQVPVGEALRQIEQVLTPLQGVAWAVDREGLLATPTNGQANPLHAREA